MNPYSTRLAWAGAMIGVLALTATVFANSRPPGDQADSAAETSLVQQADAQAQTEAVAVMAPESTASGPFLVALRVEEPPAAGRLYLCDANGCPFQEAEPDAAGDCTLGPVPVGTYAIWQDGTALGSFELLSNAGVEAADGQLWSDGEVLHLERFCPGTAVLRLILHRTGYYSLLLCDAYGRQWTRDFFIPDSALPELGRTYVRVLEFRGLPPGLYTVVRRETPLAQFTVRAGEQTQTELVIAN